MKILIFGSKGMLGKYISTYISINNPDYTVTCINRDTFDVYKKYATKTLVNDLQYIVDREYDFIINCMGITNKYTDISSMEMFVVNAYFPHILSLVCGNKSTRIIIPSTDCVFDGDKSRPCSQDDIPDSTTDYGLSKYMGETCNMRKNCITIRTSIIGETGKGSLVEWVKSNKGCVVNGFRNHLWNGVTCLEYAKIVYEIMHGTEYINKNGIYILYSTYRDDTYISKADLIRAISDVYQLGITVHDIDTTIPCDRRMSTDYAIMTSDIITQLYQLKKFGKDYLCL